MFSAREIRRSVLAALALGALVLGAGPAAAQGYDWKRGGGWGAELVGGIGFGGAGYDARKTDANGSDHDEVLAGFWQARGEVRALSPYLGSGAWSPRLLLRAAAVGPVGSDADQRFYSESDTVAFSTVTGNFEYRWLVGIGASVPIRFGKEIFMHVIPSLSYGAEQNEVAFAATNGAGLELVQDHKSLRLDEVVPGLELSIPLAHWGEPTERGVPYLRAYRGRLDFAVGLDLPIAVSDNDVSANFTQGAAPASLTFERNRVGYSAYAAVKVIFEGF
jgi:hypothetical protein